MKIRISSRMLCCALIALCMLPMGAGTARAEQPFDRDTPIRTVMEDPAFGTFGRLLFPVDEGYYSGDTLSSLRLT